MKIWLYLIECYKIKSEDSNNKCNTINKLVRYNTKVYKIANTKVIKIFTRIKD